MQWMRCSGCAFVQQPHSIPSSSKLYCMFQWGALPRHSKLWALSPCVAAAVRAVLLCTDHDLPGSVPMPAERERIRHLFQTKSNSCLGQGRERQPTAQPHLERMPLTSGIIPTPAVDTFELTGHHVRATVFPATECGRDSWPRRANADTQRV